MRARMTWTALAQGMRNAAFCFGALLLAIGLLVMPGAVALGRLDQVLFVVACAEVFAVSTVCFLASWGVGMAARGRLLLDCGPHPTRALFVAYAVIVPASMLGLLATGVSDPGRHWPIIAVGTLFAALGGLVFGLFAMGRFQMVSDAEFWTTLVVEFWTTLAG